MIQLWDINGRIILNTNDRVGKFTGSVAVSAGASGTLNVNDTGTVFAFSIPNQPDTSAADIYISAGRIDWNYPGGGYQKPPPGDCVIYYGVY